MSDSIHTHDDPLAGASQEEIMAALFANMVIQQTNMAMMLLGKVAHPQTGEFIQDLDSARMFIDQLAMLEAKTKGNLSKQEENLLKQALTSLRMAFVEATREGGEPAAEAHVQPEPAPQSRPAGPAPAAPEAKSDGGQTSAATPPPEESRKKFSKKY